MMLSLVIGKAKTELENFLNKHSGKYSVDAKWVNNWIKDKGLDFKVKIIDENGKEIKSASVLISSKG
jgi:hypothetical protein